MADRSVSVRLRAEISDYMAKMSAAGKATGDLANKVDGATGKSKQGFDVISHSMIGVGAAAVAGFGFAVKASMDFDKEMSQLQAASGESAESMKDLRDAAIQTGKDTVFSASEAAEAETALAKAGVSAADILGGALAGTVNLAAAGQIGLAEAAETAASAMTQFKLEGADVSHIADLLAAGAGKAQGGVHDLGMALNQAGLVASQTGLSIEETVGGLTAFASAGLMGSDAGTSFKTMLQRLNPQSAEAAELMDKVNLQAYDQQGNFVGLAKYAGNLRNSLKNMSDEQRNAALQTLFGSDAVRAASVLYENGAQGIRKWIDAVNDQGYAQAFASTALNNLAGDIEQFKGSVETGLILSGSKANGVMREMVQTATAVVNVYNDLPGPVQGAATALIGVGGAVTLAGGAALIFIPKWKAMNAALAETNVGAISAGKAMGTLGKAAGVAIALYGAYEGVTALKGALDGTTPSVEDFTSALTQMGVEGSAAGTQMTSMLTSLADIRDGMFLEDFAKNLDTALSGLVISGKADLAERDFERIRKALESTGMTVEEVVAIFPEYAGALKDSAAQAELAGTGIDDYGNAVGGAAEEIKQATDAVNDYSDALHALTDPLFAMSKALGGVTEAQEAARKAVNKFGADSEEARQANLDLAAAAVDVSTASAELTTAVATGAVSLVAAKDRLNEWVDQGLISERQAKDLASAFRGLIGDANDLSDVHPKVTVTADMSDLDRIDQWLANHRNSTVPLTVTASGTVLPHGAAGGGPVYGAGSGTSDSVDMRLSVGEYVIRADGSNLNDAMAYYSGRPSLLTATTSAAMRGKGAVTNHYSVTNNYPEPDRSEDSTPRSLRELAYVSGGQW